MKKKYLYLKIIILTGYLFTLLSCNPFVNSANDVNDKQLEKINLPDGFNIHVYANEVKGARSMTLGTQGTLFVGSRKE